jgi:N-methylhydantoinase A
MGRFLAEAGGFQDVVTYDMGGTSVDIGVLKDRTIATTPEAIIGDQKNAIETMDIPSIGAGGGAIARIDELGVLRIGPSSAGAEPGPACYGKGGIEPTLTDANVLLGYIPTDYFLGGTIPLDQDLAKKVIDGKIAGPLGVDTIEAAYSMSSLAETITAEKIFLTIVEKGYDPRDFVLMVGGGAGPVHAIALAIKLGMKSVYIPKHASVFSAFGGAVADYGHVLNSFYFQRDDIADIQEATKVFHTLEKEAIEILERQGVEEKDMALVRGAEMRYFGQLRDIDVALPETRRGDAITDETFKELVKGFHERHKALYGWSDPQLPATVAILKLRGIGKRRPFVITQQPLSGKDPSGALKRNRQIYFKQLEGFVETPCYDGELLKPGNLIKAPAIIEEKKTTVVVPPGSEIVVDPYDNYLATLS